jgi:ATP-dependent RNA helicase DeaD
MLRTANITAQWLKVPSADDIKAKDHDRLLEKLLTPPELDDADHALGAKLLETMSAQDIAAALVATHRAKMPAAEDLHDDGKRSGDSDSDRDSAKESHRAGFDDAVWFRINVGRKNNADPKWLLPLLCRRGGVTKNDVGAIRIMADESYVGIAVKAAKQFAKAAQKPGHDEDDDVVIVQAEGPPREVARQNRKFGRQDNARGSAFGAKPYQGRGGSRDKAGRGGKPFGEKSGGGEVLSEGRDKLRADRPDKPRNDRADKPRGNKSWGDKQRGDKPHGGKPGGDFKKGGKNSFAKKPGGRFKPSGA